MENKSTSDIQNRWQAYGPHLPTVKQFADILKFLPDYVEIQAIAIRGQGGGVVIETHHDGGDFVYAFSEEIRNGQIRFEPTTEERTHGKDE
jgi:hypothetical protein